MNNYERFISKVEKTDTCWNWTGTTANHGYGIFYEVGSTKQWLTHRWSYIFHKGVIPGRLWVLHTCDNKRCVNPEHIYLGTPKQNVKDMHDRGGFVSGHAKKTHCPRGHEYTEENIWRTKTGGRACRKCAALRSKEARARRLEKDPQAIEEYRAKSRAYHIKNRESILARKRVYDKRRWKEHKQILTMYKNKILSE